VIATDTRGEVTGSGTSRADGTFGLADLRPGRYVLAVAAAGYRATAAVAEAGVGATAGPAFELSPASSVRGTVRADDGSPLADARVSLLGPGGTVVAVGTTGAQGDYSFGGLREGEYTVIASGYATTCTKVSLSDGGRDDFDLVLTHAEHWPGPTTAERPSRSRP
jgi:hypothetical protein